MRKQTIIFALSLLVSSSIFAQDSIDFLESETVMAVVSQSNSADSMDSGILFTKNKNAQYKGGINALSVYLSKHVSYPELARENFMEGITKVKVCILADGSIGDMSVVKSAGEILDAAALAALAKMPKWQPALQIGKPVSMSVVIPVEFSIN